MSGLIERQHYTFGNDKSVYFFACSGGVGEGTINNFDDTGRPSFDPWPSEE